MARTASAEELIANTQMAAKRGIKVGILGDEFFDPALGRMGGFGWAARRLAECLGADPRVKDVVYFTNELRGGGSRSETTVHGTRLLLRRENRLLDLRRAWGERVDLLLVIDYNLGYRFLSVALALTPLIFWIRDPRTPADVAKINTLSIPGAAAEHPEGIVPFDGRSLAGIVRASRWSRRPIAFASPAPRLQSRLKQAYGVELDLQFLPNPVDLDPGSVAKSGRPTVVFLGRLDPIKRPWLFVELARRFPQVEFRFMGKSHYTGRGGWQPADLPANVRLMGHVGEPEKTQLLSQAWALVNTSIHEGLPVSFLEALACETPLLGCQDPEGVVSRYGIYTGRWDGDGVDALPAFADGLKALLENPARRVELGREGRAWVNATHNRARFLESFFGLCAAMGVGG